MRESHRGVWVAPWQGPGGELVLFAMTHEHRLLCDPLIVPHGADHVAAADALYDELEACDPVSVAPAPPRFTRLRWARVRARVRGLEVV